MVPRTAFDVDDIEIDDFEHALLWVDRVREVVARENPKLTDDGALRLGNFTDPHRPGSEETVSVELNDSGDGKPYITVGRGNGFSSMTVGLCFDLKSKRVMAGADSSTDAFPQPQPAWTNIEGTVQLTSWDWTPNKRASDGVLAPDHRPVVIEYDLSGRRGHEPCTIHGRVVLAR